MWLWKRRERFSLEELKYLTEQLQRTSAVNEYNKDSVVETLRSIAELMIWGDQRDPSLFEYFMEKQVMVLFLQILELSSSTTAVAVQLLQSISIMIQNIRNDHAIYYIFSNGYLNHFITYPFDFRDEELLAYYISFLRTTSTKLDQTTISFFIKTENDEVVSFPLYTEAIRFFRHEESMVRIAVRALTLNVYHVNDKGVRKFVSSKKVVGYITELVKFLKEKCCALDELMVDVERNPDSSQSIARLEGCVAETEEILDYCNDIVSAGIPDLARAMTEDLLHLFVVPLLCSLAAGNALTALYLLARVLHVIKHKPLANGIAAALVCESFVHDISTEKEPKVSVSNSSDASMGSRENGVATSCPMEFVLSHVVSHDDKVVVASVTFLLALLHNEVDESILDVLGLLPRLKQHKRRLLQTLMGSNLGSKDEELLFSSAPRRHGEGTLDICDYSALMTESEQTVDGKDLRAIATDEDSKACELKCNTLMRMQEAVVKKLLEEVCRRPPPSGEALWQCGALLWQVFPYHQEDDVYKSRLEMIRSAYLEAKENLLKELDDCWCDVIPSVLAGVWNTSKRALEGSQYREDAAVLLIPKTQRTMLEDHFSSSAVSERMQAAVQVFVALHQLQQVLAGQSIPEAAPLQPWSLDYSVKVGSELYLSSERALPCRIAFERGKERAVHLVATLKGVSGWLVLAEETSAKNGQGIIRVIAPLAGCLPEIDEEHPRWLHLRIRPPQLPNSDKQQASGSKSNRMRRIDGRWTLAFSDAESCMAAKQAVLRQISVQKEAVKQVLEPLLSDSARS